MPAGTGHAAHSVMHGRSLTAASQGTADACKHRAQRHSSYTCSISLHSNSPASRAFASHATADSSWGQPSRQSFKLLQVSTSFQPSRQWLSVVWLAAMRPNIERANRYMSTVKGRFWYSDHTLATAYIRDAGQQSLKQCCPHHCQRAQPAGGCDADETGKQTT